MPLLVTLALLTVIARGTVSPYAPDVAERVFERRIRWQQVPQYRPACLVALNDDHIGEYVLVLRPEHRPELCLVVDCAQPLHAIERNKRGLVLETDYHTFHRWRGGEVIVLGRGGDAVGLRCSNQGC